MSENQDAIAQQRGGVYIDGFNLYHPVHEFGEPFLKWANLWRLSEIICERFGSTLVKVVFCTAVPRDDHGKRDRHNSFNNAQRAMGVEVLNGHHVIDDAGKRNEKCSDINLALSVILDAQDDVIDHAYILSADSDQGATAKTFKARFPHKKLYGVAPPTKDVPDKVRDHADDSFVLTKLHIETCVMPAFVPGKTGLIRMPAEYARPAWWVHPDDRPRKKPLTPP